MGECNKCDPEANYWCVVHRKERADYMERGASLDEALPTAEIAGASPASIPNTVNMTILEGEQ